MTPAKKRASRPRARPRQEDLAAPSVLESPVLPRTENVVEDVTPPPLPVEEPEPQPQPEKTPVPWRWWESFLVFALSLASSVFLAILVSTFAKGDLGKAVAVVTFELSLGFWSVMWVRLRFHEGIRRLGVRTDQLGGDVGAGLAWGFLGWIAATLVVGTITIRIAQWIKGNTISQPDQLDLSHPSALVLFITAVGVIVIAPMCEELFFRGFIYQAFRRRVPFLPAAVASAAMFMFAHVPFWLIFPSIFTLGIVLSALFERRDSVVPGMAAHALFNAIGFVAYLITLKT